MKTSRFTIQNVRGEFFIKGRRIIWELNPIRTQSEVTSMWGCATIARGLQRVSERIIETTDSHDNN
jgi:hypothetical protein